MRSDLREGSAICHDEWHGRSDPARNDRVAEQVMCEVEQAVENHDGQRHFKWHSQQFRHQWNGREVDRTHQKALTVIRPLEFIMNERQTDFERSGRPIWLLLTIDAFSAQDFYSERTKQSSGRTAIRRALPGCSLNYMFGSECFAIKRQRVSFRHINRVVTQKTCLKHCITGKRFEAFFGDVDVTQAAWCARAVHQVFHIINESC